MNTKERLHKVLNDFDYGNAREWLPTDTPVDFGLDSLDQLEIIVAVELEFDIEITDDEADSMITLADLENLVMEKVRT